ncbi:MAG: transglycosylase SLT domain-containing protein [Bacteroidota bacterium]
MKKLLLLLTLSCATWMALANDNPAFNEQEIISRIKQMKNGAVDARYTSVVRSYLKGYLDYRRSGSETTLGRSAMYFPMFERELAAKDIPEDIKYLAIVESALLPKAVSRAGAVGLWQFMPLTAKDMGLVNNSAVDERKDPFKSTQAAARYLKMQYNRFGSWELALAAYNGGSGTVSRAIKRARSKDFWAIRKYLPKETRNYVPAFIAATYLGKYYDEHDLSPNYPELDVQLTAQMMVHDYVTFLKLSKLTGVDIDVIRTLNPGYKKDYIPSSKRGYSLILPKRAMPSVRTYLQAMKPDSEKVDEPTLIASLLAGVTPKEDYYTEAKYTMRDGQTMDSLVQLFQVDPFFIRVWNKMGQNATLNVGQQIVLYGMHIKNVVEIEEEKAMVEAMPPVEEIEQLPTTELAEVEVEKVLPEGTFERDSYLFYTVESGENLEQIADRFEEVNIRDIMILNNFRSMQIPQAGKAIKIKKI